MNKYSSNMRLFVTLFVILIPFWAKAQVINRASMRDDWIAQMDKIAEQSGVERAKQVVNFVKINNVLAEPHPQGHRFLEQGKTERWIVFIPMVQDDARLSPFWASKVNAQNAGAFFFPENRTLLVKDQWPMSPTWKGILGLHEGYHAMAFMNMLYNFRDKQVFCEQERDTHIFQNTVTEKIGGQKYRDFVEKLSREIEAELKKRDLQAGKHILNRSKSFAELDEIFGPPLSDYERNLRDTHTWLHAYFIFYDRIFGKEAEMRKGLYLLSIYFSNGTLNRD